MTELKPCPFCGGEVELVKQKSGEFKFVLVSCKNCDATIGIGGSDNEKKVTKAWNTRPNPWHTGTPTEEGWYLCKLKAVDLYETHYFTGNNWCEHVEKWQKIEYKEATE